MIEPLVNEDIQPWGTDWYVSLDGLNTGDESQSVCVVNSEEAFKLQKIISDLKQAIAFLCEIIEPVLDEKYEYEAKLSIQVDEIKDKFL